MIGSGTVLKESWLYKASIGVMMSEPKLFTMIRHKDESGISGTGRVLDGVIFHTGQVVICWRSDINPDKPGYSSIIIYPSWDAFLHIHVHPHAEDATEIKFVSDGEDDFRMPQLGC